MAARKALAEIRDAQDREHAEKAITAFATLFGTKHPKAIAKVVEDAEQLLAFYDFPAEHWVHLEDEQSHRVRLRDGEAADQSDQGAGQPRGLRRTRVFTRRRGWVTERNSDAATSAPLDREGIHR